MESNNKIENNIELTNSHFSEKEYYNMSESVEKFKDHSSESNYESDFLKASAAKKQDKSVQVNFKSPEKFQTPKPFNADSLTPVQIENKNEFFLDFDLCLEKYSFFCFKFKKKNE